MKIRAYTSIYLFLYSLTLSIGFAAESPLDVSAKFDLSKSSSNGTFFEIMTKEKDGIKAALDVDYEKPVVITDAKTFRKKSSNFEHLAELERQIKGGAQGLDKLISQLEGKKIPEDKMYGAMMDAFRTNGLFLSDDSRKQSRLVGAMIPIIALTSGKGVLVQLDHENYCYNYGYAKGSGGSDLEKDKLDRKSGRSFGASKTRNAYDPSDNDYLRELAEYTAKADVRELKKFYTVVFEILLKSDTSGIKGLEDEGQTVVADFMAIYMAELDRHLMTGLKMYEWENALTEITMMAAYSASDEGYTLDPTGGPSNDNVRSYKASKELKPKDRLLGFFGVGTDGSGLDGKNKERRHTMTRAIVKDVRGLDEKMLLNLESLIGARAGADVYDEVMEYINNFKTQNSLKKNADSLIKGLVDFVMITHTSAAKIRIQ